MKTNLYDDHVKLGAKLVDFAGWQMPIQYKNLREEVLAVRESVGVFDVSHMGEFLITGKDTVKFVDHLLTNDIYNAQIGKAIYSPLCREDGTIIDDLIAYKLKEEEILLCVNASNIKKDFDWIKSQSIDFDVELADKSSMYALIALQGPKSFKVLSSLKYLQNVKDIDYYSIQVMDDHETTPTMIARTGYTGEDGFEVFGSHLHIKAIWDELMELDVKPCGLGARDVLRLEVCYPLYGNELNDEVTPLESALGWTTKLDKDNFIGKDELMKRKSTTRLIKLSLEKGIPRSGYKILNQRDEDIGFVTSGSMSVMLGKGIAMARVDKEAYNENDELFVEIRNKKYLANRSKAAFYKGGAKK